MGSADGLRAALIGLGTMGRGHLKALLRHPGFSLVAAAEPNAALHEALPAGLPRYTSAEHLLAKHPVDLLVLVLPNHLYEPHVALAAKHKVHVLCEKPFGHCLASARRMTVLAADAGIKGFVGAQWKYMPHFRTALADIQKLPPAFVAGGYLYYGETSAGNLAWRANRAQSGGLALIDNGWHSLDLLSHVLGHPVQVHCTTAPFPGYDNLDMVAALTFKYANGAVAQIQANPIHPIYGLSFTFMAQKQSIHVAMDKAEYYDTYHLTRTIAAQRCDLLGELYTNVAAALAGQTAFVTTFAHAQRIMQTVEACYASATEGRAVTC